ncbi:hypothetical protein [Escherichia coli]
MTLRLTRIDELIRDSITIWKRVIGAIFSVSTQPDKVQLTAKPIS